MIHPFYFFHVLKFCFLMLIVSSSSGMAGLRCMTLLAMASLKPAACWLRQKQTSPRGPGSATLGAVAIFHSLSSLQRRQYCSGNRHRQQKGRRCRIFSQYRSSAMTRWALDPLCGPHVHCKSLSSSRRLRCSLLPRVILFSSHVCYDIRGPYFKFMRILK